MAAKHEEQLAFTRSNYRLMLIGAVIIVIGYMLMAGGGSGDPNVFDEKEIFSPRRITVAPIVCLIGYIVVIWSIMKKPTAEA